MSELTDVEYFSLANLAYLNWHNLVIGARDDLAEKKKKVIEKSVVNILKGAIESSEKQKTALDKIDNDEKKLKEENNRLKSQEQNARTNSMMARHQRSSSGYYPNNMTPPSESEIQNFDQQADLAKQQRKRNDEALKGLKKDKIDAKKGNIKDDELAEIYFSIIPSDKMEKLKPTTVFNPYKKGEKLDLYKEDNVGIGFFYKEENKELYLDKLKDWYFLDAVSEITGLQASAFYKKTGDVVVSYRGTEQIIDWGTNILSFLNINSPQFFGTLDFFSKILSLEKIDATQQTNNKIHVTGHSLGGALSNYAVLAVLNPQYKVLSSTFTGLLLSFFNPIAGVGYYAATLIALQIAMTAQKYLYKIKSVVTFNGLGTSFVSDTIDASLYKTNNIFVKNYILNGDLVGDNTIKKNAELIQVDKNTSGNTTYHPVLYHGISNFIPYSEKDGNFKDKKGNNIPREIYFKNAIKTAVKGQSLESALLKCQSLDKAKNKLEEDAKNALRTVFKQASNFHRLIRDEGVKNISSSYKTKTEGTADIFVIGEKNNWELCQNIEGGFPIKIEWNKKKVEEEKAKGVPVLQGAMLACDKGVAPGTLTVTSQLKVMLEGKLQATEKDCQPIVNIPPFGLCQLKPLEPPATGFYPCLMWMNLQKWSGGKDAISGKNLVSGQAPLLSKATCKCAIGGTISIKNPMSTKIKSD